MTAYASYDDYANAAARPCPVCLEPDGGEDSPLCRCRALRLAWDRARAKFVSGILVKLPKAIATGRLDWITEAMEAASAGIADMDEGFKAAFKPRRNWEL